jgi:20S proteasome alpha/beta subunit
MSIVVYRDGIIASDSAITEGGVLIGTARKIARVQAGWLVGAVGCAIDIERFLTVFSHLRSTSRNPPQLVQLTANVQAGFTGLVVGPEDATIYEKGGCFVLDAPKGIAIGSGADIARGVMWTGQRPEMAVLAAIELCGSCGGAMQYECAPWLEPPTA